jgi:cyd operon protein YbgT
MRYRVGALQIMFWVTVFFVPLIALYSWVYMACLITSKRSVSEGGMWYFTWILGLGLALAFGIINVMWLEASYFSGELMRRGCASNAAGDLSIDTPFVWNSA